jgi:NAD(P)-dependent dehydrogenase (short-subunit alcohol dehydrogenase family)
MTVIVTGGAAGIGEATARRFAEHAADVVVVDIAADRAQGLAQELQQYATRSFAVPGDVTQASDVSGIVDECLRRLGKIDILVNAAGGFPEHRLVADTSESEWDRVVDLNLKSVFLCSWAVLPHMMSQRFGRIVSVSSEAARTNLHLTAAHYAAAKAGILAFTRHLAREVASYNITVNATTPGPTRSDRIQRLYDEDHVQVMSEGIPMGRFGEPEEQADSILFLASDAARYITGVTLDVNGGKLML